MTQESNMSAKAQKTDPALMRRNALRPAVDVFENTDQITVYADLPGVNSDQLNIEINGRVLAIEASPKLSTPKNMRVAHAEFQAPSYYREFMLSGELDTSTVVAQLNDGVLRLVIPKGEHAKPRKIAVSTG
jgi:HSP20 family protein